MNVIRLILITFMMSRTGIPVLTYHSLCKQEDENLSPVHIAKEAFEQQMQWLAENGYTTITLEELHRYITTAISPHKYVVLTFDDGYQSYHTIATPVLKQYGFRGTLFLTTAAVGHSSYAALPGNEYTGNDRPLTLAELQYMKEEGWNIQPHGHQHLPHNEIPAAVLYEEMKIAADWIQEQLGIQPAYYAFPYGRYNTRALNLLSTIGLKGAFSVHPGLANKGADVRRIPRVGIDRYDDINRFIHKVTTGYIDRKQELKSVLMYQLIYKNTRIKDLLKKVMNKING